MYQKRNNVYAIMALFTGDYERRYYLRQISKISRLPLKTCQNVLSYLENEKILIGKLEGKNKYFNLNLNNLKTKSILLQTEAYKTDIFMKEYPFMSIFLKSINTLAPLIVFGSYARFEADKRSDLDLLVLSESKLPLHLLPIKIHKINMSKNTFKKAVVKHENLIKEIEDNHVILNNHSFYIDTMWGQYAR